MHAICSSCGSQKIVSDLSIVDYGDYGQKLQLSIETHKNPKAFLFKGISKHPLKAIVCCDCGQVDLKIENVAELWENHLKRSKS
ncbi:hypothetical protein [Spongiimicrobium salis]|uniref:hypothetical protein n=1 Tax=Spongiimicrobium salis TaxID=1667022 RepID=UPI00374CDC09